MKVMSCERSGKIKKNIKSKFSLFFIPKYEKKAVPDELLVHSVALRCPFMDNNAYILGFLHVHCNLS